MDYSNQRAYASLPYPIEHSWDLHIILLNGFFNMHRSIHSYIIIIKVDIIIWWRIPIYRTNSFKFLILQHNCTCQIDPSISLLPHVDGRYFIYTESHQFSLLKSFSSLQQILNHIKYLNHLCLPILSSSTPQPLPRSTIVYSCNLLLKFEFSLPTRPLFDVTRRN